MKQRFFNFKSVFFLGIDLAAVVLLLIIFCNWHVEMRSDERTYDVVEEVPVNKAALVLGTAKYLRGGRVNLYFKYRLDAAAALYECGKVKFIVVSGDNHVAYYNEPIEMKKGLIERGVPEEVIYLDYAGFRTLDSVVRAKKIFGQNSITIVSQEFHTRRAVYIARKYGINAVGFNAKDVSMRTGVKVRMRESLARVKVFIDLYIINKQPKFLGEPVVVG